MTPNYSITMWDINMRDYVLVTYKIDHILPSMDVHLANGTSKPTLMTLGLIFSYELN
jgi:hypothetical protein